MCIEENYSHEGGKWGGHRPGGEKAAELNVSSANLCQHDVVIRLWSLTVRQMIASALTLLLGTFKNSHFRYGFSFSAYVILS